MASHPQVGSPVTPALANAPKDAALHLLCLAAEANHQHPHTAQSLPQQHHAHYPIYLSPPPPPPSHSHYLYQPFHYASASHALPHHPIVHALPYPHQQQHQPHHHHHHPQQHPHAIQTPQSHLPYSPLLPSRPSQVLPVPLPLPSPAPIQSPVHKVKGPWRPEEDSILTELVSKLGPRRWTVIASHIPGRTGKQARERWLNQLSPHLAKRPWTPDEDRIVMDAHARLGNRWSEIAKLLNGRTDNATKNRFNTTIRRQISELSSHAREELAAGVTKVDGVATSMVTTASKSTTPPTSPNTSDAENERKGKRKREAISRVIEPLAQRPKTVTASS